MAVLPVATLKTNMPIGQSGQTSVQDIHNIVDTMDAMRPFVNVKQFGAVGDDAADDTQAFIDAFAAGAGGTIFVPKGVYRINANTLNLPSKTSLIGAGLGAEMKKQTNGDLIRHHGTATWGDGARVINSFVKDLFFNGGDMTGAIISIKHCSEFEMTGCHFFGNSGIGIDCVEIWDSRFTNCFLEWLGGGVAMVRLRNSDGTTNVEYEDSSNATTFLGCRFESYACPCILIERGGGGADLAHIYITDTKMETSFFRAPMIVMDMGARNVHISNLFLAANNFDSGYSTPHELVRICGFFISVKQVFAWIGAANMVSSIIYDGGLSADNDSCLVEHVSFQGSSPTVAMIDIGGAAWKNLKIIGPISSGGSGGTGYKTIANNAGGNYPLTASTTAVLFHDGLTFTNNTGGNVTVTLPSSLPTGWRCKALQLSAAGTITFAAGSGATLLPSTAGHNKTGGQGSIVDVWVYANNSTLTAAAASLSGKTA